MVKAPKKKFVIPVLSRGQLIEQSRLNEEMCSGPNSATPKDVSEIQAAQNCLAADVGRTLSLVSNLRDRLADVLAPEKDIVKAKDDTVPSTTLGRSIVAINTAITNINGMLEDIRDRLRL